MYRISVFSVAIGVVVRVITFGVDIRRHYYRMLGITSALDTDDGWTGAMRNEWCAAPARLALLPLATQLACTGTVFVGTKVSTERCVVRNVRTTC